MTLHCIIVYIPESHLDQVKQAMFDAGAGKIGNYSCCAWEVKGTGQFRPEVGSNAFLGEIGKVEKVIEYQLHTFSDEEHLPKIIAAMKASHPYEVPAYSVIKPEGY